MSVAETKLETLLEHRRQFLGFVQRRVGDAALAEDILQAAYMRALQHDGDVRAAESAVAWFYRILRNAVIDHYRRRSTESEALMAWGREMEDAVVPAPEIRDEVCRCLTVAIDNLPVNYAELLRHVDLAEQPLSSFAQSRKITAANAAVRAHRARTALRRELIRTCGACAEHGCEQCTCLRC